MSVNVRLNTSEMGARRKENTLLAPFLTLLMLGKLAGETSINGIVDWIKERQGWLRA